MSYTITPEDGRHVVRDGSGRVIAQCRYLEGAQNVITSAMMAVVAKEAKAERTKIAYDNRDITSYRKVGSYLNYLAAADLVGIVDMKAFEFRVLFHLACLCKDDDFVDTSFNEISDACNIHISAIRTAISNLWYGAWLRFNSSDMDRERIYRFELRRPKLVRYRAVRL